MPAIAKSADQEGDANYYAYFMDAQKQVRPIHFIRLYKIRSRFTHLVDRKI